MKNKKIDKLYIAKFILSIALIIIILLGMFVLKTDICIYIAFILVGVIFAIHSVSDFKKGKKANMWVDILIAVLSIVRGITLLFGIDLITMI